MEYTSGEARCKKRRCTNPTRSTTTQTEHGTTVVLPAEMWRPILLNLWYDEEDHETIRCCRLVSHSFKDLVDSLPPKRYWNPWLKFSGHHSYSYLNNSPATNFTGDNEIYEFLKKLPSPNSAAKGANPFPVNQTVRLFTPFPRFYTKAGKDELKDILHKYGSFIKKLIVDPTRARKCLSDLPRILPSMVNLETLIIKVNYQLDEVEKCSKISYPTDLRKLSELVIANCCLTQNEDWSLFFNLAESYGAQIKHLTLPCVAIDTDSRSILEKFPNLENLKVKDLLVNTIYLEKPLIGNSWPRLRRLALRTDGCQEGSIGFKNMVKLVTLFSSTLELLSLDLGRPEEPDSDDDLEISSFFRENDEDDDDVLFITPFPQLKKIILPFCFVSRSQLTLEERFNFDFSELKVVILQDFEEEFLADEISKVELSRICTPLWRLFPPSVDTICVRTETWKPHLGMRVPVLYKCSTTSAL